MIISCLQYKNNRRYHQQKACGHRNAKYANKPGVIIKVYFAHHQKVAAHKSEA